MLTNSLTLERIYQIMVIAPDGKRAIAIDKENKAEILSFLNQTHRYLRKYRHIVELIIGGHRNEDLYDKEDINEKCNHVTAMKFFKGQENERIYCQEITTANGMHLIIMSELHRGKKTTRNSKKEISIIKKVCGYEYKTEQGAGQS